jgi:predicted deacylase
MAERVTVAGVTAGPGERVTGIVSVPVGEATAEVPVVVINGSTRGPRLALLGGIHGAEYPGIEAARRVAMSLDPAELAGTVVAVPLCSPIAFHKRTIYTSGLSDQNINRCFPGDPGGTGTERLANWLFETIIRPSDYLMDLHGGDMIESCLPFVIYSHAPDPTVQDTERHMAFATGLPCIVYAAVVGSTFSCAAEIGIPAICQEIGGQGVWNEGVVDMHVRGVHGVLRCLGLLEGETVRSGEQHHYDTFPWVRSSSKGLFHPSIRVGDFVEKGQKVGSIIDYFGEEIEPVEAPDAGEVIFVVTSLAMNPGDPLFAVAS